MLAVSRFRGRAKVPYPNAYATHAEAKEDKEKYLFNCAQRAHANFLEHQPSFLVGLMVGGLRCKIDSVHHDGNELWSMRNMANTPDIDPVFSAVVGLGWCAARVAYGVGYCRRDKERGSGRRIGSSIAGLSELILICMSGVAGYQIVTA